MTRIRWIVAVVSIVVVGFGAVMVVALGSDEQPTSSLLNEPAPEFFVRDFDNAPIALSSYRGRVVLINFWNEWCAPCIEETPDLIALADSRKEDDDFAMIGVVHDARSDKLAREYADLHGLNYTLVFDPGARIALDYRVEGQPESFVIDRNGIVRSFVAGPIDVRQMSALITELQR